LGESQAAIEKARYVQQQGFYAMPVRPPTVPQNSSRLRISLTSLVQKNELEQLVECL
jgi:8-amino-7-oxononanoate synthase